MKNIKVYFSKLNSDIREARTRKALKLLERRGRTFVASLNGPMIDIKIRKQAQRALAKSLRLIKTMMKRL